jgi:hypothetical protein
MANSKTRLAAVVLTFGLIWLGIGGATIPVGIAIPYALASLPQANAPVAIMAMTAALGVSAFVLSIAFDADHRPWRLASVVVIAGLTCSTVVILLVSERPALSLMSSLPFAATTAFFAGRLRTP